MKSVYGAAEKLFTAQLAVVAAMGCQSDEGAIAVEANALGIQRIENLICCYNSSVQYSEAQPGPNCLQGGGESCTSDSDCWSGDCDNFVCLWHY